MGTYIIRQLQADSIMKDPDQAKSGREMMKIKENTFPEIPSKLRIRPRAATFVKATRQTSYAVLYVDDKNQECLFVFNYDKKAFGGFFVDSCFYDCDKGNNEYVFYLCRCIGRTIVNQHIGKVMDYIVNHEQSILGLSEGQSLTFE